MFFKMRRCGRRIGSFLLFAIFGNFIVITMIQVFDFHLTPLPTGTDSSITGRFSQHDDVSSKSNTRNTMTSRGVDLSEKIDWNNYTLMALDRLREGLGEHGKPSIDMNLSGQERNLSELLYNTHKFNAFLSSKISCQRSIGDQRDEMCQHTNFTRHIPPASISFVIPFYNEHNYTLLRTVFSIVNRTPKSLLKEIVMVDDSSSLSELKLPLDAYIAKNDNLRKVKILRNKNRLGLISSRMVGADASTGRFLIFLDAHVEINYNFVPPLIEPILFDSKTVTCPVIDNINRYDFGVARIAYERNAFRWDMKNEHFKIFPEDAANLPAPFPTPVMMGGAFAIDREWWKTIGKYDPGLEVWGGEQYEISFKIWMCGGKLLNVPCSRVAHVFRHQPYPIVRNIYARNLKRVAAVWMDDYQKYLFKRLPGVEKADPGDLSSRVALRQRLQCKNFDWYMKNIAYDVLYNWPVVEPPILAWGSLRPKFQQELCVKFSSIEEQHDSVFVDKCERDVNDFKFEYSWRKTIKEWSYIRCLETRKKEAVAVHHFRLNATQQQFAWNRQKGWIVSEFTGYCLHYDKQTAGLDMRPCANESSFFWTFGGYDDALVDEQWEKFNQNWAL